MNIREVAIKMLAVLIDQELTHREIVEILEKNLFYNYVPRKKKDGSVRKCYAPNEELKRLQRAILEKILYKIPVSGNLYGFVPEIQMKTGATKHIRRGLERYIDGVKVINENSVSPWMLQLDLADFFPSIKKEIVNAMLEDVLTSLAYERFLRDGDVFIELCKIITEIVTYKGGLPQGASTSPYIANLVVSWSGVAEELASYCYNDIYPACSFVFSFYADDITVSSLARGRPSIKKSIKSIERGGVVRINPKKTRLNNLKHRSHRITGISIHARVDFNGDIRDARTTLSRKTQKFYRGRIAKAIELLRRGHIPDLDEDGLSLQQIRGYIGWTKHVCGEHIPSCLKKIIPLFEELSKGKDL